MAVICDGVWNHILHDYGSSKFHKSFVENGNQN